MNQLDLNGPWQLRWYDGQRGANRTAAERDQTEPRHYMTARVPGEVHLDLMKAGLIADTNRGANVLAARWVEEFFWTYRRTFDAPPGAIEPRARAWLVFDRLDLAARIVLNGVEVGRHANSFRPCRIDVTGRLRAGTNVLVAHVESGLHSVSDKPAEGYAQHDDALLHKRHWLRKPQCSFGWDWSPRLINVGITGPVRLEWTDAPLRVDQFVPLVTLSEDLSRGRVEGRVFVEALRESTAHLELSIPELGLRARAAAALQPGAHRIEAALEVPSPQAWWPIGHGPQRLYTVRAEVKAVGAEPIVREARVGFRHVRWDQSPHPVSGQYFRLLVNGRPIFCKGGNFVPADTITARIDADRYRRLIDLAVESNFNFLRVWGGGLYEDDVFYDLCDERGILVWQEFIYACARYPMTDETFHSDAREEARRQIRRLAPRASLVAWCGNNEMEEANWHWGYDRRVVHPDMSFFHLTLPRLLAAEDGTRHYQPSSPMSPMGVDPRANEIGDQHPWSLGFFDTDARKYREMICRFPNEGGMLGPTSLPTMMECVDGDARIGSFAWRVHDNSVATWREPDAIDAMTDAMLGKPIERMSIEEYVYWGGVAQGEGLREYIDNFRRRMFDSASAIFWMYNDTWPAVRSWTTVDYHLRRTPLFHYVRRAMAPVHVVLAVEAEQVVVFGVNDTLEAVDADLRFGLFDLGGGYPMDERQRVRLAPNSAAPLARFPQSRWTAASMTGAFAVLSDPSSARILARNRLFLPVLRDLRWSAPAIDARRDGQTLRFRSDVYVPAVSVDLDGVPAADNFFDLLPGVEHVVTWRSDQPATLRVGDMSREGVALQTRAL